MRRKNSLPSSRQRDYFKVQGLGCNLWTVRTRWKLHTTDWGEPSSDAMLIKIYVQGSMKSIPSVKGKFLLASNWGKGGKEGERATCSMLLMKVCGWLQRGVSITNNTTVGNVLANASVIIWPEADQVKISICPGVSAIIYFGAGSRFFSHKETTCKPWYVSVTCSLQFIFC